MIKTIGRRQTGAMGLLLQWGDEEVKRKRMGGDGRLLQQEPRK